MNDSVTKADSKAVKSKGKKHKQLKITNHYLSKKSRFGGLSIDDVMKKSLPDYMRNGLDIVFVGINPGLAAAFSGKYYTGPGNHFWKCLYLSGLIDKPFTSNDDQKLLDYNIGFTNMVSRTTKGSNDLCKEELIAGSKVLKEKIQLYRPLIVVFNGKISYQVFSGKKDFFFGKQSELVEGTDTHIWVMPSSSARCAQLPRAEDKVPFFTGLKRFCLYLKGVGTCSVDENIDFVFKNNCLQSWTKVK
ncbi:G/T mismatch-specific thymine DNA glycosylase [Hydra vulgaris]|uniref:G/T mismatch-specific thymine DNA glycosylase n=1 Tax=Hydra vulgaris TaxID=6087 RepID=UPI0002B45C63|nr:G/T mismatch-specific thymine DNA glycosylase [Hydra vulgaris]